MSDESILTDPIRQLNALRRLPARTVSVPASTWTQIVPPDPLRQMFWVGSYGDTRNLAVRPEPQGAPPAAGGGSLDDGKVFHSAVYPGIINGAWYAYSSVLITVVVVDVTRSDI